MRNSLKILQFLGLNALPDNLYKYNTATWQEYLQCADYLSVIRDELPQFAIKDFISLDVFFWRQSDYGTFCYRLEFGIEGFGRLVEHPQKYLEFVEIREPKILFIDRIFS